MKAYPEETRVLVKHVPETRRVLPIDPRDALVRTPVLLGRENVGELLAGSDVTTVTVSSRVPVKTYSSCGTCQQCPANRRHPCLNLRLFSKMGLRGFWNFTVVPDSVLRSIGADLSFAQISVLEPLGIGLRLAMEGDISARTLLVCGCGPLGLFAIAAARAPGASRIIVTDVEPNRLYLSGSIGADSVVDVSQATLFDAIRHIEGVAIEAFGNEHAICDALSVLTPKGIMLLGRNARGTPDSGPCSAANCKEQPLQGVYGRSIDETWLVAEQLLRSGKLVVDTVLTHTFRLAD